MAESRRPPKHATRRFYVGRLNPATGRGVTDEREIEAALGEGAALYPDLRGVAVASAAAECAESLTDDMLPIIDRVPGLANAWVATGWSGHGFAIGPAVGAALAEWVVTGKVPTTLSPVAAGRWS